jgi:uncharacterized repeat protein (TIGR02543 family)
MTRAGYTFDGWYKDAAYTAPWNLASDTVSANITLHAKWNQDTVQPVYYTVSFNAAGGTPAPQNQTIAAGGTVSQPAAMTKANHTFGGWYTEAAYTTQWNFSVNTVNAALTLHAKWEADTSDKVLAVTLPGAGGVLTVPYGSNAAAVLDIGTDSAPYAGPETAPAEFQLAQDVKDALANAASISVNLKSSEAADISLAWVHYLRKATTDAKPGITITEVNADESKFTPVFSSTEWFNGSTSWETKNLYSQYKVSGAFVDSGREIIDLFNNHLNPPVIVYDATNYSHS